VPPLLLDPKNALFSLTVPDSAEFLMRGLIFPITLLSLTLLGQGCQQTQSPPAKPTASLQAPSPIPPTQPLTVALATPNTTVSQDVNAFLAGVEATNALQNHQGVWIQTKDQLLANYQGTVPLSAASLTKVATSLAALQTLGPNYRFTTQVGITGSIQKGVLKGDLVIQGGQDPFFVWEDVIALANLLQQQGIQQIQGNLILLGPFYMNFETDASTAGAFLKQGLDSALWPAEALQQYQTLPPNTPKPSLVIAGTLTTTAPPSVQWILRRDSLPLTDLLKKMNRYSNNPMADMMANSIGGAQVVAQKAIATTGIPAVEIQLVNGSGLAIKNRMSPRAVCALFLAIEKLLQPQNKTVADIFTVMGQDESVLDQRPLPKQSVLKSGTLDTVSALAGALPTQKASVVWFVMMNNAGDVKAFRRLQEKLLDTLQNTLGATTSVPTELKTTASPTSALRHEQLWTPL
jgi:D-alanyl-D-alanine carboxypeptidase/D-alanyl-D-alanine-endopeptidase (penicillin-binding protein 4)